MAHLMCGKVVIFGPLDAIMLNLSLLCGNVLIFHYGVAENSLCLTCV